MGQCQLSSSSHRPKLVRWPPTISASVSSTLLSISKSSSAWRWKVYDRQPYERLTLLEAMEEACDDIDVSAIQGWIRHSRRFFPRCSAREDIACDVDEVLWPGPARRRDAPEALFSSVFLFKKKKVFLKDFLYVYCVVRHNLCLYNCYYLFCMNVAPIFFGQK